MPLTESVRHTLIGRLNNIKLNLIHLDIPYQVHLVSPHVNLLECKGLHQSSMVLDPSATGRIQYLPILLYLETPLLSRSRMTRSIHHRNLPTSRVTSISLRRHSRIMASRSTSDFLISQMRVFCITPRHNPEERTGLISVYRLHPQRIWASLD